MSFDEAHLDDVEGCKKLSTATSDELRGWIDKFTYYRNYPVKGRLIPDSLMPDPERIVTKEELKSHVGSQETPEGFGSAPIFVGAGDKVYDMSFGGGGFYGPGGPYNKFAGES
jgi:membrane-associated progesterone receptor component